MEKIEIFKWNFDNPKLSDGTDKPNELLGVFKMTPKWVSEMNDYSFVTYGIKDSEMWKIKGVERSGMNGGTLVFVEKLSDSQDVQAYLNFSTIAKEVID